MHFATEWALQTWSVLLEAGPWLLGGFLLAGLIHTLVPVEQVTRHLGRPGLAGVLKAAMIGAPLPLCSCSVIPVASSIRRQGASRGATASFLVSAPETGLDSIAVSYALLGPFMAAMRPIAALVTAIAVGVTIDAWDPDPKRERQTQQEPSASSRCCHCSPQPAAQVTRLGLVARVRSAIRYGFVEMFEDLGHWLLLGFVLAGLVSAVVPAELFDRSIGKGPLAMLLMLGIGLPLYICATGSTPVAAALIAKGLSPGAALVFLLAGPATNVTTMLIVGRQLGRRSLVLYVLTIAVVAMLFGLGTDLVLSSSPVLTQSLHAHCQADARRGSWPFAVGLLVLTVHGIGQRVRRFFHSAT